MTSKTLLKDSFNYALSKAIPGFLGFFSVILFVRLVGENEYGRYALDLSIIYATGALFTGWITQSILRYYSFYVHKLRPFCFAVQISLTISIIFGALVIILFYSTNYLWGVPVSFQTMLVVLLLFTLFCIYNIRLTAFQAKLEPKAILIFELIRAGLSVFFPLMLILFIDKSSLSILFGIFLGYFVALMWLENRSLPREVNLGNKNEIDDWKIFFKQFLSYGWPLSFWLGATMLLPAIDRYLIDYFYSYSETGAYSSLYDIVFRSYSLILFPITLAAHPRIMQAWNKKHHNEAFSIIRWALIFQAIIFIPTLLFLIVYSNNLVDFLLPGTTQSVASLVVPLAIGGFLWQLALLFHKPLEVTKKTIQMLIAAIFALIIGIAGNYYWLPKLGIIASAYMTIATGFTYCLISLAMYFFFNKDKG